MKIHNQLPILIECLTRWKSLPSEKQFVTEYAGPMSETSGDFFEEYYRVLTRLNWQDYRSHALAINPKQEEARFQKHLKSVEELFKFKLEGEVVLMGSFAGMDGYARFDRGSHKVYLGIDENFHRPYIDILMTHELTHVARESRGTVWEGFGLNPKMTQDEFTESQPVIEHLMGEGFSCAVSEILVPGQPAWDYVYQTQDTLQQIHREKDVLNAFIKTELNDPNGDYGRYYRFTPRYGHYYWAWRWVKQLLEDHGGNHPKNLVDRCSADFMAHALEFQI